MMKYMKLYEELEDFEEVLEEEPEKQELEINLTGVQLGRGGPDFNVLDKVKVFSIINKKLNHSIGYIIDHYIFGKYHYYLIYFINNIGGHDMNNIPDGHGLWVPAKNLRKV